MPAVLTRATLSAPGCGQGFEAIALWISWRKKLPYRDRRLTAKRHPHPRSPQTRSRFSTRVCISRLFILEHRNVLANTLNIQSFCAAVPKPQPETLGSEGSGCASVQRSRTNGDRGRIFLGASRDIITRLFAKTTSGSGLLRLIPLKPNFGSTVLPLSFGRYVRYLWSMVAPGVTDPPVIAATLPLLSLHVGEPENERV